IGCTVLQEHRSRAELVLQSVEQALGEHGFPRMRRPDNGQDHQRTSPRVSVCPTDSLGSDVRTITAAFILGSNVAIHGASECQATSMPNPQTGPRPERITPRSALGSSSTAAANSPGCVTAPGISNSRRS